MRTLMIAAIVCAIMVVTDAHGESFMVLEIQGDLSAAFLLDQDTGVEWEVATGDMIAAWTVEEITTDSVLLSKTGEDGMILMTRIPFVSASIAVPVISVESP